MNARNAATAPVRGDKPSPGKKILNYAVKYLLPLVLSVALVWYMLDHVDIAAMMDIIRKGVNYWWILLAMGLSVISHIIRATRWRIQLDSLGIKPGLMPLSCSIFGCYALNLVFPRLGEVWRCTYIAQRQKASFTTVFGSMVADRLSDTVMVLAITLFTFLAAHSAMIAFLAKYPVGQDMIAMVEQPLFWVAVAAAAAALWALFHFGRNNRFVKKIRSAAANLWNGFASVAKMRGKWLFIILTVALWSCYFLQLYVAFFAFGFTRDLCAESSLAFGLTPCLVAFVLSSIGMAIPSNGGLGPWNIAVMFGLALYGISETQGTAFSMLVWSAQTVMLIILGIFTMIYISASSPALAGKALKGTDRKEGI